MQQATVSTRGEHSTQMHVTTSWGGEGHGHANQQRGKRATTEGNRAKADTGDGWEKRAIAETIG
eukprot:2946997-Lingulodinium_polyedra.AAC.1